MAHSGERGFPEHVGWTYLGWDVCCWADAGSVWATETRPFLGRQSGVEEDAEEKEETLQ